MEDANNQLAQNNHEKAHMQESLKKAFMRGVCALNFEAMNILTPSEQDKGSHLNQMEQEMISQMRMQQMATRSQGRSAEEDGLSQVSYNISEASERKQEPPSYQNLGQFGVVFDQRGENRIESRDHMWKPAPIVGRDFVQQEVKVSQPMSQQL